MSNPVRILYPAEQQLASFSLLCIQLSSLVALHRAEQQLCHLVLQQQNVLQKFSV